MSSFNLPVGFSSRPALSNPRQRIVVSSSNEEKTGWDMVEELANANNLSIRQFGNKFDVDVCYDHLIIDSPMN